MRMLTISKPVQHGYRPVHDLPTPPSTSRPSPPLTYLEPGQQPLLTCHGASNTSDRLMSAPHRGLPPPAALPPVQSPSGSGPAQPPSGLSVGQIGPPPAHSHSQSLGQLPAAPSWHDDSMRAWLAAKTEEDKRRQEEERTRQESYRLEQRKMEAEILRTSLQGGIPPPLVPVVFAGMGGGGLSPVALEWAQQFMAAQSPGLQAPAALMPPGSIASEHQRRDSQAQAYGQYPVAGGGVPSTPGSAQGPPSVYMSGYPGSPTRPRGQTMPGAISGRTLVGGGPNLPNLNTSMSGGAPGSAHHPTFAQAQQQQQQQQQQQEAQASPSIYFHHWQPPTTQAGGRSGAEQPATPSGESPRKRKAPGSQPSAPAPAAAQRQRSPPFAHSAGLSNPPPGRRRGHSRQRSDLGSYRTGTGRLRAESSGPGRDMSPMHTSGSSSVRDGGEALPSAHQHQGQAPPVVSAPAQTPAPGRTGAHSVSSLLSDHPQSPRATAHFGSAAPASEARHHHGHQQQQQQQHSMSHSNQQQLGESERRLSRRSSVEQLRGVGGGSGGGGGGGGGGAQGSTATRPGDNK